MEVKYLDLFNHVKINILLVSDTYLLNFQTQRILAHKDAMKKNHKLQEYIKKQIAYFKEIDELEMEVESSDELDHPPYFKKKVEQKVESDEVCDHQLHDSYFKESDEFELEVESGHELNHELLDHELDHQLQEYIKKHNVLLWI